MTWEAESSDGSLYVALRLTKAQAMEIASEIMSRLTGSHELLEFKHIQHAELTEKEGKWSLDIDLGSTWTTLSFTDRFNVGKALEVLEERVK